MKKIIRPALALVLTILLLAGCAEQPSDNSSSLAGTVISGNQVLVAVAESRDSSMAQLYALERTAGGWQLRSGPLPGIIGRNGFAPVGKKREGDGRVPTGLFPLEFAFGYDAAITSKMPYRQATENDVWVDDVNSSEYNTWVKRGETSASSFEVMKLADVRYRHGLVIGYNRNPIVKGYGSGIFLHVWLEQGYTTSGCVAMDEQELIKILAWLDPAQQPQILMGTRQDLAVVLASLPPLPAGTEKPGVVEPQIRDAVAGLGERIVEYRADNGFFGMALAVPASVSDTMKAKTSWHEGCPVAISDLSYLVLTHQGLDGQPKVGRLVVHKKLALPVVKAFADLFQARFPIERMELIEQYDASDDRSMEANNTSGFNCRDVTGKPGVFSNHSYGGAIDINPLLNPYVSPMNDILKLMGWDGVTDKGVFLGANGYAALQPALLFCTQRPNDCLVLPSAGGAYVDRTLPVPGYLLPDTPAVRAFTDRGFDWGGSWGRLLDYQHFEYPAAKLQ